jgi:hypothetical protein
MPERPRTKMPQEPEYWDDLTRKIHEDATGPLAAYRAAAPSTWYASLSHQAPWLIAASAAAMLLLWLSLPAPDSSQVLRQMEASLTPSEVAGTLVGGSAPPRIDMLMAQFPPPPEGEGSR